MQYPMIEKAYMVYLKKWEKIISSLIRFCAVNIFCNAQLTRIGALQSIEISVYGTEKKNISDRMIVMGLVHRTGSGFILYAPRENI